MYYLIKETLTACDENAILSDGAPYAAVLTTQEWQLKRDSFDMLIDMEMDGRQETKARYGFEYLILGNHFDTNDNGGFYFGACTAPEHLKRYVKMCVEGMETGLFAYFAHPDLFLRKYPRFDGYARAASLELCRAAKALNIPLEYNLLGFINCRGLTEGLGYPCRGFWETAAEVGAESVVGLDAHSPARFDELREWEDACAFLDSLGLRRRERLAL